MLGPLILVKEHKIKNSRLVADHVRPITVHSGLWRCFVSAWLKSAQMEDWIRSFLHPSGVYGRGGDLQDAAAMILQTYAECGYIATLDFTNSFF